jgi:hypothetical protein
MATRRVGKQASQKAALSKAGTIRTTRARSAVVGLTKAGGTSTAKRTTHTMTQDLRDTSWQPVQRADFLVRILGNKRVAELLSVSASQPSQWRRAKEVPGPEVAPVLLDLDHVVGRLLLIWDASVIVDWLTGPNAFLDGARPIDVLATRGSTEVIEAIEAEAQGAYA